MLVKLINQTPNEIIGWVMRRHPRMEAALAQVRDDVPWCKREIAEHQAAALYALARGCNASAAHILEIGTALGYSAAVMARAAPLASIVTLNPKRKEYVVAVKVLGSGDYQNVRVLARRSWDYLAGYDGPDLDMVFVDGDHGLVVRDLPWFDWLKVGGLLLFHDYTPAQLGKRPCAPVYETVNAFEDALGREPDVLVIDDAGDGMAGYRRRADERCPALDEARHVWHLDVPTRQWVRGYG